MRDRLPAVPLVAYLGLLLAYPAAFAGRLALTDGASGAFPTLENFRMLARDLATGRPASGSGSPRT